jgi:hypothetical protein
MTKLVHAQPGASDFIPADYLHGLDRDPIATVRSLINVVSDQARTSMHLHIYTKIRGSSIRRQYMNTVFEILRQKNLQLVLDVATRWSSTRLMIERALDLREVSLLSIYNLTDVSPR